MKAILSNQKFQLGILVVFSIGFFSGLMLNRVYEFKVQSVIFSPGSKYGDVENDSYGHIGESIIADELAQKVRVVCMILTMPQNHDLKAVAVQDTWASRCNAYFFLSSVENKTLHSVVAVKEEGREALWDKTKFGVRYAAEKYSDYDFFLKADDDTFVIVENLRKLLKDYSPNDPFMMGRRFRPFVKQGYLSGGGGYVMSRAALLKLNYGLYNETKCAGRASGGSEDVRIGVCASVVGVRIVDSLDEHGLERFHPFGPGYMMSKYMLQATEWFIAYNYHKINTGMECCSDYAVTFHYIQPADMYVYHYFLYHLHPYGIHRDFLDLVNLLNNTRLVV